LFERFTERARQAVVPAQEEARGLKHNYVGTGLNEGVAAVIRAGSGVTAPKLAGAVVDALGGRPPAGYLEGFSGEPPRATKIVASRRTGALLSGWLVFGLSLGLGILAGWLIWGL
jgi:ATP-dependent Clp protease ATP-binding subunit ClpC